MSPSSADTLAGLSAAQRQRLAYIDFRLYFLGTVARRDVLQRFGVASAAGTRDLALYAELAPGNARYQRKAFHWQPGFVPLFAHQAGAVLAALTGAPAQQGDAAGAEAGDILPHAVPAPLNLPELDTLATVTRAIQGGQALQLRYHSMKQGAQPREIVPHALVDSGLRWHVRAFDRTRGHFRDLVLTRMENVQPAPGAAGAPAPGERGADDTQWHRTVALRLLPHPAHPHPASVERDFGMTGGHLDVQLRAAVAGHVLRQWQVDCSPDAHLRGPQHRLWLADATPLQGVGSAALAPGYGTLSDGAGVEAV
ncbi:Predicted DNA-binding transcriptional regulator YafY, contains an HTH and WYL domains [Oryzisolibacter propanilivorax]|uniref:Predicted DNA-binding transcriptional regulator YafY, contains an HTH and WYL domains n=1 Tax=Oryzisolibacter propanilivorax TaxID=1527607 RepID=A0A1G9RRT0_9BURK|nr:WYL domain-containing protein [Oryzisolibacter propanilivorax]SDM25677.1 Predicted DNA-binding transcriptional regulator YafY, contains an HTH and WYL domains [Oryzisolibacter propanilivorax]